ncbi:hypothetical protein TNCV_1892981 [Trichonephila clavipes]|nr:hypothetical protein TNCV_1892981 [Trichonephila clavipes]
MRFAKVLWGKYNGSHNQTGMGDSVKESSLGGRLDVKKHCQKPPRHPSRHSYEFMFGILFVESRVRILVSLKIRNVKFVEASGWWENL